MRFNQVAIAGRLTEDPELKNTAGGSVICEMRLAFDQGTAENKKTGYANVTAFGKTAERAAQYLKKGAAVLFGGRIDYQEWQTQEGHKRSTIKIVAHDVQFLERKPGNEQGGGQGGGQGALQKGSDGW
jgi:single-strand DNA-binding protein